MLRREAEPDKGYGKEMISVNIPPTGSSLYSPAPRRAPEKGGSMRKILSIISVLALSVGVPLVSEVVTAGPASATGCQPGETIHAESSFTPNPVHHNALTFQNDVTLTNCTNTSQTFDYSGTVSAPTLCGGGNIAFGPINKTLAANATATYTQVIDQAPTCTGTYTQVLKVTQSGTTLTTITVTFSVIN